MKPALAALLHNPLVWRGDQLARADDAVCSGFPELDRELPGGGWPKRALTELLHDAQGIGELRLLLPALGRLARSGETIVLVAPPQHSLRAGIRRFRHRAGPAFRRRRGGRQGSLVVGRAGAARKQRRGAAFLAGQPQRSAFAAPAACRAGQRYAGLPVRRHGLRGAGLAVAAALATGRGKRPSARRCVQAPRRRHGPAFAAGCLGRVRCGGSASAGAWRNRRRTGSQLSSCGNPEGELQAALSGRRSVGADLESCAGARR